MKFLKTIIRRVIISAIREGKIKRFDADGLNPDEFLDREFFQQYGLTSWPKANAEGLVIGSGNVFYLIASDDRAIRLQLTAEGDVALYTDTNNYVLLKANGNMLLKSAAKVTVDSPAVELANGALKKLIDERFKTLYDAHTHLYSPGPGAAAPTAAPAVPLDLASNATTKTTAS